MPSRLEVLEQFVARSPTDPFPYYGLALEYRSANRLEDALRIFRILREQFPDYVPQYLMAGQICASTGDHDGARAWWQQGVAVAEDARDAHTLAELRAALAQP